LVIESVRSFEIKRLRIINIPTEDKAAEVIPHGLNDRLSI